MIQVSIVDGKRSSFNIGSIKLGQLVSLDSCPDKYFYALRESSDSFDALCIHGKHVCLERIFKLDTSKVSLATENIQLTLSNVD